MNKGLLEVYALSVCFVSMGCLSIFSGIFLYSLAEMSFPTVMKPNYMSYPPSLSYSQGDEGNMPALPVQVSPRFSVNEAIKTNAEKNKNLEMGQNRLEKLQSERAQSESIKSMVRSIIIIFIALLVFIFHWRIAKEARNSST